MSHPSVENIIPPRPLTPREQELLQYLLQAEFPGKQALVKQAETLLVSGHCACGCASILFRVDTTSAPSALVQRRIPVEAEGADMDGVIIHFLLHVVQGWLSELEIFREDSEPILKLPPTKTLQVLILD